MNEALGSLYFTDLRVRGKFFADVSFRRELWVYRSINTTRNPGVASARIIIDVYTFRGMDLSIAGEERTCATMRAKWEVADLDLGETDGTELRTLFKGHYQPQYP
jgi:hypothetical protein